MLTVDELIAQLEKIRDESPNEGRTVVLVDVDGTNCFPAGQCAYDDVVKEGTRFVSPRIEIEPSCRPDPIYPAELVDECEE